MPFYLTCSAEFKRRRLRKGVVPSVFSWKRKPSPPPEGPSRRSRLRDTLQERVGCVRTLFDDEEPCDNVGPVEEDAGSADNPPFGELPEVQYVCDILPDIQCFEEEVGSPRGSSGGGVSSDESGADSESEQEEARGHTLSFSASSFKDDDKGIHFHAGLETYSKFMFVFSTLWPEAATLNYRENIAIAPEDAFLLTLMKLRRNTSLYELGRFFGITERQVSNVFFTWVHFMSDMWSMLDLWPPRELIDFYMPEGFKAAYPATRVIVDCTEIPIEKPNHPGAQQASFSQYKNRNTVKVEVGASPAGLLCHLSDAYGRSASDRQIVERSGLISKCEKNDSVMADRGFNVQDLFAPKDVTVNIPSFVKDGQLPGLTVLKDRAYQLKECTLRG